ncbi:MAG: ATP-binding protein [Limibacillus sp.]
MLLQNALQFAQEKVEATLSWDAGTLRLTLHDDGPGFDAARLEKLGQPYVGEGSRRRAARGEPDGRQESPHMGLGIFIAHALLARSGARLLFENHPAGGATVEITWDRATLDLQDEDQTAGLRSR